MTKANWEEQLRDTQPGGRGWSSQLARKVEQRIEQTEKGRGRANAFKWAGGMTAAAALAAVVLVVGGPAMEGKFGGADGQGGPDVPAPVQTQPDGETKPSQKDAEYRDLPDAIRTLKRAKVVDPVVDLVPKGLIEYKRFDSVGEDRMIEEWWDPQTQSYRVHEMQVNGWELNTIRVGSTMWVWKYNEKGELALAEKALLNPREVWKRGWDSLFAPYVAGGESEDIGTTTFAGMTAVVMKHKLDPVASKGLEQFTMLDSTTRLPIAHVFQETGKSEWRDTYQYRYENDYDKIFTPPQGVTFIEKDLRHVPTPEEITEQNQNMSPDEQTDPTKWPKHSSEDY